MNTYDNQAWHAPFLYREHGNFITYMYFDYCLVISMLRKYSLHSQIYDVPDKQISSFLNQPVCPKRHIFKDGGNKAYCIYNYGLHGGSGALGAGVGAPGVRVLRLQMLMQRERHSCLTRTSHVGRRFRGFRTVGAIPIMLLHPSEARLLHFGAQIARQSSSRSAIAGGPMDKRTSMVQAAKGMSFLSIVPLADQHLMQLDIYGSREIEQQTYSIS
jgi:hypothetical protein